jgi:uncharacterized membrane protein YwzB
MAASLMVSNTVVVIANVNSFIFDYLDGKKQQYIYIPLVTLFL